MSDPAQRLLAIASALREAGDRGNINALRRGLRAASAPLVSAVHDAALNQLPRTGGLNEHVAGQRVSVRTRLSARTADVRLTTSAPDTAQTDAGYVRHPTFGRRSAGNWQTQRIPSAAGWWSTTLLDKTPEVTAALEAELDVVSARIAKL